MTRRRWAILAVAAALAGAAAVAFLVWRGPAEAPASGPMIGKRAPKIADNVEFWLNGQELELAGLEGRPLLLVFWHPLDKGGRSLAALPHVRGLADSLGPKGLLTLGCCVLDTPAEAEPILREHGITFLTALDCDADLHCDYRVDTIGTPYAYLIDGGAAIVWEGPPEKLTAHRIRRYLP